MSRQARLGLLILAGLAVGVGALFILASQGNLLRSTYTVNAQFVRVQGLRGGATVYYNGIGVGRVQEVRLPRRPGDPILVRLSVQESARNLIRQDSRAIIQSDGLVGNMVVTLTGGSLAAAPVPDNGYITGVDPFDFATTFETISDRLFDSVARFDSVTIGLTAIMNDTRSGEGTLGRFLYDDRLYESAVATTNEFQFALRGFSARADQLILVAENASRSVDAILARVNSREGTIGRFLNDDELYRSFLGTAGQLQAAAAQFQTVTGDVRIITDRFNQAAGWASLGAFRFSARVSAMACSRTSNGAIS
jgi:phospholipid/cholesterol/gamma-HCH transport system substrate-binding protein